MSEIPSVRAIHTRLGKVPGLADLLKQIDQSKPVVLRDITPSAQACLVSLLAARRADHNVWVVCPNVRTQEHLAGELTNWTDAIRLFPEMVDVVEDALPDPETASERLAILQDLARGAKGQVLVFTAHDWDKAVPLPKTLQKDAVALQRGQEIAMEALIEQLVGRGYELVPQILNRGQISRRGGILDMFSFQHAMPVRVEFFGDEIDSIREFDLDTQVSVQTVERVEILLAPSRTKTGSLAAYRAPRDLVLAVELPEFPAAVHLTAEPSDASASETAFYPLSFGEFGAGDLILDEARRRQFFRQVQDWLVQKWYVALFCANEGERERFTELAKENQLELEGLHFLEGSPQRGFFQPGGKLAILSDAEIFGRTSGQRARRLALRRERFRSGRAGSDFSEFEEGDYVVHLDHGIGRYAGLTKLKGTDGVETDVLVLEFAKEARLFVPLDQAWQVARYVGLGKKNPELSELGDSKWARAKEKASKSIYDYASQMLRIQAERETATGFASPPDTHWQEEFEKSFPFKETPDQLRAIEETKRDMESTRPMDRLICGDVGFGKTEVAIRAAFKAVMSGKQVVVLAPTTVLAQQHYQNFRERMSDYPVSVEVLNRYRTRGEQRRILTALLAGSLDIVVGTHRLLSEDVRFKNLGLVVVDEEQRFGVKDKDTLKERFRLVDVLTLSATPIPRTLYLSLMGARDMSLIETPPLNRQPVETVICGYDERVMRDAIKRELERGGQVYVLHNRVLTIEKMAARIRELCPGAKVAVGHGQMEQGELEEIMKMFVEARVDVLVSTTIIESGLDIPNANTMIIDRADRFGLADLYQLRGRVGRSQNKAYAYLMIPRDLMAIGAARKRISAIKQYSELGAGFKIAMRDLEIRGAGNLLGTAQSGHILAVGFDLYCKMLKAAVNRLQGKRVIDAQSAGLRLDFLETNEANFLQPGNGRSASFLPSTFIPNASQRIEAYRKLAECGAKRELDRLSREWRDRYGPLPAAVTHLLLSTEIRLEAARRKIRMVEVKEGKVMLTRGGDYVLIGKRFPRLTASEAESKLREILSLITKFGAR